jgi:RNA polymerase sigma-70 factor (ECF subfamily)
LPFAGNNFIIVIKTLKATAVIISSCTDSELLLAMRHDDKGAFAELFRRHWSRVHAMTYTRVRSVEVTKEIVQDLFMSLWEKRATLVIDNLPAYLYTAIKNRVVNYVESQIIRKKHWDYYKRMIPEHYRVAQNDAGVNELMEAIQTGMDYLPEKSKKVFVLNRMEGRSIAEIAHILNLSEKAIQYHLTQSIKKLRLHLKDYILLGSLFLEVLLK